jgi:hypothetical protein
MVTVQALMTPRVRKQSLRETKLDQWGVHMHKCIFFEHMLECSACISTQENSQIMKIQFSIYIHSLRLRTATVVTCSTICLIRAKRSGDSCSTCCLPRGVSEDQYFAYSAANMSTTWQYASPWSLKSCDRTASVYGVQTWLSVRTSRFKY